MIWAETCVASLNVLKQRLPKRVNLVQQVCQLGMWQLQHNPIALGQRLISTVVFLYNSYISYTFVTHVVF